MIDLANPSTWLTGGAGTAILVLAYKFLWPVLNSALNSAVSNARTGDAIMKQLTEERDRAVKRADEAEAKADAMVKELFELKNSVNLLTFQLKIATERIDALSADLRRFEGNNHA